MPRDLVSPVRPACRPGQACRLDGLRVLLADDDPERRASRTRALERHGFVVRAAADLAEALDVVMQANWPCDIAVVELGHGVISAVTLINALRGLRPWLPAVIIGSDVPPPSPILRDSDIATRWVGSARNPVKLSAAIMAASCRGIEPPDCPFRLLIGTGSQDQTEPRPRVRISRCAGAAAR